MQTAPTPETLPLVTVVTATFNLLKANREQSFRQCVESVHAQHGAAIDHLVVDGASNDGTRELIAEYEAKGWLRCICEPDKGIYDAMNKGLREARGKYIAFLNSDDYWHDPEGVAATVRQLEETGAAFSYAPYEMLTDKGKRILPLEPELGSFVSEMPICHQTMFTRTDIMREMGGFDWQHYRVIADNDFLTRLLLAGHKAVYVPLRFTTYRLGGLSNVAVEGNLYDEYLTLYRQHYAPLVGERAEEPLSKYNLPDCLLPALAARLDPGVMALVSRYFRQQAGTAPARLNPSSTTTTSWYGPLGIPLLSRCVQEGGSHTQYKLFCCLPLLHVSRTSQYAIKTVYRILGIPVWSVKSSPGFSTKHYLFGCLPMYKVRQTQG